MTTEQQMVREKVAFDGEPQPGWRFVATYLEPPHDQDALIEIFKNGDLIKSTLWPAYKIWNVAAHSDDIIRDLEEGLSIAGSTGFGGNVYVPPVESR